MGYRTEGTGQLIPFIRTTFREQGNVQDDITSSVLSGIFS
jgi:hypothetical protein